MPWSILMSDPLGLVASAARLSPPTPPVAGRAGGPGGPAAPGTPGGGPNFTEVFREEIARVNELQRDAKEATEDWATGRRQDTEAVIQATAKADLAFRGLMSVRNKVLEAYDEIKQVRV
jgi:flagellar hook-basal body complex protein FliE